MDRKHLKKFLREQVYIQRNHYVRNKHLTESQKFKKVVSILRENERLDEGLFDSLGSIVGGGKQKVKNFLARRVISYLGIPTSHPLNTYLLEYFNKRSMEEIRGLFLGKKSNRTHFSYYTATATLKILENNFGQMFGLRNDSLLGAELTRGVVEAVKSKEFARSLFNNYEKIFVRLADADLDSPEAAEDTDGDGVTDGDEQVAGSDPEIPDEPESIKQKVAGTEPPESPEETMKDKIAGEPVDEPIDFDPGLFGNEPAEESTKGWAIGWEKEGRIVSNHPDWVENGSVYVYTREQIKEKIANWPEGVRYYITSHIMGEDGTWKMVDDDWRPMDWHPDWAEDKPAAVGDPDPAVSVDKPAGVESEVPEESAELTTEEKHEQITEFVKRFTPGGAVGVYSDPKKGGKGHITWIRKFHVHQDGDDRGKIKNWKGVDKIYKDFARAASDDDKIEALYKSKFIKDAGYEAIQANRGGAPEGDLESAKATGDPEKVAGAAAATVADTSVDDGTREDAGEALEDAIDDAPVSEDPPPPEDEMINVEDLLAAWDTMPSLGSDRTLPSDRVFGGGSGEEQEAAIDDIFPPKPEETEASVAEPIPADIRKKYQRLVNSYNREGISDAEERGIRKQLDGLEEDYPGIDTEVAPEGEVGPEAEAEAAEQDTEADAADAVADDLARAAANEPEDVALKQQAADAREKANQEREEADEAGAYEEPTWQKNITSAREAVLKAAIAADAGGSEKLYRRGINEFIDKMMDNWEPELRNKAENAKVVKQTKKMTAEEYFEQNKHKYATEVWPGEVSKQLRGVAKSIKEKGTTAGMGGVFNFRGSDGKVIEVVPGAEEEAGATPTPEEPEAKRYNQVNVELYDDKTVVLTDRSLRGKIKRSKIGEGMLSEMEWSGTAAQSAGPLTFRREGVTVVELPPIPVEKLAKISGWGTANSDHKQSLTDEIYNLLKQKAEADPEAVEDFDLTSNEETGKPSLVVMGLSTPTGERDKWSGVFDHRTPAAPELPHTLKALYSKLARNYVKSTTDKEMKSFAGDFNNKQAEKDYPMSKPGQKGASFMAKKVLKLADEMGVEYTDIEAMDYMSGIIRNILIAGGSGTEFIEKKEQEQPSGVPKLSDDDREELDDEFEKSLAGEEEGEELDEVLKISDDLLRRLLA